MSKLGIYNIYYMFSNPNKYLDLKLDPNLELYKHFIFRPIKNLFGLIEVVVTLNFHKWTFIYIHIFFRQPKIE